jgi:hypothetical protein
MSSNNNDAGLGGASLDWGGLHMVGRRGRRQGRGPIDLASPLSELLLLHDVVVVGSGGWSGAGRGPSDLASLSGTS